MNFKYMKKFISVFFLIIIFCLIVSTLISPVLANEYFYHAMWFKVLGAILSISLLICTVSFLKKKLFTFAVICLGVLLILSGGLLSSFLGEEGFIEIKEGQSVNGFWIEDDLFRSLDFSVSLNDFSVEFYPKQRKEMRFVKSYKSSVAFKRDGGLLKEGIIEVNKPLRFQGFWFYQYGYDADYPEQTLLQIVKDPGLGFVYSGYLILLLGLLCSFKKIWKI